MSRRTLRDRLPWLYRLAPAVLLTALAFPLLAPTCNQGGTGLRTFSKKSIIIPMDACYQGDGATTPVGCPGAADKGKLMYGYGLVYMLLQNNITVYWVIDQSKKALTDVDLTVQFNAGAPVGKYSWTNGTFASAPPNNTTHVATYRGGPFVIDGADFDAVNQLLQGSLKANFSAVNLHVSNVAFTGYAAKAMNGGWQAGGNTPPPVALLNITGGDCKNSLGTVKQYLIDAGLGNLPGAAGTAAGPHGSIYDVLDYNDFLPDLARSNLGKNGYRVLWAPHWVAKWSCTTTCNSSGACPTQITQTNIDAIKNTITGFVGAGNDFFSECSSIGAVEGDANACDTASIVQNTGAGRIASTGGLSINQYGWDFQCPGQGQTSKPSRTFYPSPYFAPLTFTQFSSPLLQIGDFAFAANSGAVGNYAPLASTTWKPGVQHLIQDSTQKWDVFTLLPGANGAGTTVYLAGHDYSTAGNPYQLAGSRLVLNTLFNLGGGCVSTNADCQTGQLGECGRGKMQCVNGALSCVQVTQPSTELCDGLDNDCDGLVDDNLSKGCYGGPAGTQNVGVCRGGTSTCVNGTWGTCAGEVKPSSEICNGLDDDCDGTKDDGVPDQACYGGPVGSAGVGLCKAGTQKCVSGSYGACTGEVLPVAEQCSNGKDDNCDGAIDEGCGCVNGQTQPCYGGPVGTAGVGECHAGTQTCASQKWGSCVGEVKPKTELCNMKDDDCDGQIDEDGVCDECKAGDTRACYTGPAGTQNVGVCKAGVQGCENGKWAVCQSQVLPGVELCDGRDNDCDGQADDGALCPDKLACVNGVCVPATCGGEVSGCPEGYGCKGGACGTVPCGAVTCPAGQRCIGGVCSDPCATVKCAQGSTCAGGVCTAGGCYAGGCKPGESCIAGACVADTCDGVTCPTASFCRDGYCVQSCVFLTCPQGKRCGPDGLCLDDPCAAVTCMNGQICQNGTCVADTCSGLACGTGQICEGGKCVDDPCNRVHCPVGTCVDGQCFGGLLPDGGTRDSGRIESDASLMVISPDAAEGDDGDNGTGLDLPDAGEDGTGTATASKSCGCGASGGDAALPWFALGAAFVLLRRRSAKLPLVAALAIAAVSVTACMSDTAPSGTSARCFTAGECPASSTCVAYQCVPLKVRPDAGPETIDLGDNETPDCDQCGTNTCLDLRTNPEHCGQCGHMCLPSERCVDGACGPTAFIGPALASVTPTTAQQLPDVSIELKGERFKSGAQVHLMGKNLPDIPATFVDASKLTAKLDLSALAPGAVELRVVNPDHVISNGVTFTVTAAMPHIDKLTPAQGTRGQTVAVIVEGSGFVKTSLCKVSGTGLPEQGLKTTFVGPTSLQCSFDLSKVQPGAYDLAVVNDGTLRSNSATFTVLTAKPVLSSISPSSGRPGAQLSVTAIGSGFDATSVLRFRGSALNTTWVSGTQLFASPLDLSKVAPGTYDVDVLNNGTTASNKLTFTVTSNPPQLTSLSPTSGLQGTTVPLIVSGDGFESTSVIWAYDPSGKGTALTTTVVSSIEVRATLDLTGKAAGTWLIQVVTAGNLTSNSLPFTVKSNLAAVTALTPQGAAQGTTVDLDLTGSNFLPGAQVRIGGNGRTTTSYPTTVNSTTSVTATGISLSGWNTGTYSVTVMNPNASASNAVGFTVFAGAPTLTSVSPTSATQGTTVIVTLTGTNFAKPDANGSGGSTVHASAPSIGIMDAVVPCTVSSATKITVTLDTTESPPATFDISVWNPGGTPPPQKTATKQFTVAP